MPSASYYAILREVRRYEVPTIEEEEHLVERIRQGDEKAVSELVNGNLRLVLTIANKYDINDVVKAAEIYASATGRRITYEYILIENVNDTVDHAKELVNLLRGQLASVNLIPLNPVTERDWKQPSAGRVEFFKNYLLENHVTATVRKEMGQDIKAACGQLRNRNLTSL